MFICIPYFRYRKEGSIERPVYTTSFEKAIEYSKNYLYKEHGDDCNVSVYFYDKEYENEYIDIEVIDKLDCNIQIDINDAICEVVKGNGYCCQAVIIYEAIKI